jgi:hypothetical protein
MLFDNEEDQAFLSFHSFNKYSGKGTKPFTYHTKERQRDWTMGHLYPLGERRDKRITDGARTSALLPGRRPLFLKSYLDSL